MLLDEIKDQLSLNLGEHMTSPIQGRPSAECGNWDNPMVRLGSRGGESTLVHGGRLRACSVCLS